MSLLLLSGSVSPRLCKRSSLLPLWLALPTLTESSLLLLTLSLLPSSTRLRLPSSTSLLLRLPRTELAWVHPGQMPSSLLSYHLNSRSPHPCPQSSLLISNVFLLPTLHLAHLRALKRIDGLVPHWSLTCPAGEATMGASIWMGMYSGSFRSSL